MTVPAAIGLVVTPAYGRDYKSKKAVLEDWNNNKDFRIGLDGPYISRSATISHKVPEIWVRYYRLRFTIKLPL